MTQFFKNYFYYTQSEIRGVIILTALLFLIGMMRFFLFSNSEENGIDKSSFEAKVALIASLESSEPNYDTPQSNKKTKEIETFSFNPNTATQTDFERLGLSPKTAQSIINYRNSGGKFYKPDDFKKIYTLKSDDFERLKPFIYIENSFANKETRQETAERKVEQFEFDPNTATQVDFERLGLSGRTAQSIINYRDKGGKFYKPEDFKKIYTLKPEDFERLKPFINIPPKAETLAKESNETEEEARRFTTTPNKPYIKKSTTVKIDINTAAIEEFQQLKGIGEGFAKRIVKYREKLGGFVSIEQVQEVYGFPKETFENIQPQLVLTAPKIQKININTATYQILVAHPYIDSKRANAIIKYRKQHGDFKSVNDLKNIYAIPEKVLEQIKPYLEVN